MKTSKSWEKKLYLVLEKALVFLFVKQKVDMNHKFLMDNHPYFDKRAEQLTVADFILLTQHLSLLMQA